MGWQAFPIKYGHAPDLDPTSPDAWSIVGALPYENGIGPEPYWLSLQTSALSGTPLNGFDKEYYPSGYAIVGTGTYLWKIRDVVPSPLASTVSLTLSATNWSFATFGDNVLAADVSTAILRYTGTGTFSAAGNAPKAKIIVNAGFPAAPQIFAFDYNDGTRYTDGWYCSALSSDTSWTANYASGCANGRLLEPTGAITAAIPFRDGVVVFKRNAMYYGEYGPDGVNVIQWRRLSSQVGCIGMHALCHAQDVIYFAAPDGFYMYDGSYPQKLPGYVHNEFAGLTETQLASVGDAWHCAYLTSSSIVIWTYVTAMPGTADLYNADGFAYNAKSRLWTRTRSARYHGVTDTSSFMFRLKNNSSYGVGRGGGTDWRFGETGGAYKSAHIISPRFGNGGGVTLSGVWPYWFYNSSINAFASVNGPTSGTVWSATGSTATPLLSFQGFSAPQLSTPTTTVTGVADNVLGRAAGSVTNRWASVKFAVGEGYTYRFSSVMLDVRYGPRTP